MLTRIWKQQYIKGNGHLPIPRRAFGLSAEKRKAQFLYNRPDDYKTVFANGVYGGVSTRGDIHCHFFVEHQTLPTTEEYELAKDGKLGKKIEDAREISTIARDLKVGIVFKVEDAEDIANWLLHKVKLIRGEKTE